MPNGDHTREKPPKKSEPAPKTQEKPNEPKPKPPEGPRDDGGDPTITELATPCLCPCPVGIKAIIKIQEDVTPIHFNLLTEPDEIICGKQTKFFVEYDEKTIVVPYDFHDKDEIGMGNDGNVNLMYTLTIYYPSAPPPSCCETGTIEFSGDISLRGTYNPWFGDPITVSVKTSVKGNDSFSKCPEKTKDQCKKVFKDDYNKNFSFKVPHNPIPGLKNWYNSSVRIKGEFSVTIITKKIN